MKEVGGREKEEGGWKGGEKNCGEKKERNVFCSRPFLAGGAVAQDRKGQKPGGTGHEES